MSYLNTFQRRSSVDQKRNQKPFFSKADSSAVATQPFFQPKLTINQPGDKYEQEADAMAEKVVSQSLTPHQSPIANHLSPTTSLSRKCAECEKEGQLQRMEMPEEELQAKSLMRTTQNGATATPKLASQLNRTKGGGSSLPKGTLSSMNQAFGTDFSNVRIHTDRQAREMSEGVQAKAFTHGSDIYFNEGQYNPDSTEGKRLLAHELTHTIQQKGASFNQRISRQSVEGLAMPTAAAVASVPWSLFWRQVIKRFAIRGAAAIGLTVIDGPLPIGDLIALGLTIWTIYEIISLWDVLWAAAAEEMARCQAVKTECIEECLDELPTGRKNGFPFWNCVNACMARHGC